MNGPFEWFGAIGTIVAAGLIATNLGRKVTGWAFVLFVFVSISWITAGLLTDNSPITLQNVAMLVVNAWGVYQYLLNPRKKRELELIDECAVEAQEQVEEEVAEATEENGEASPRQVARSPKAPSPA